MEPTDKVQIKSLCKSHILSKNKQVNLLQTESNYLSTQHRGCCLVEVGSGGGLRRTEIGQGDTQTTIGRRTSRLHRRRLPPLRHLRLSFSSVPERPPAPLQKQNRPITSCARLDLRSRTGNAPSPSSSA